MSVGMALAAMMYDDRIARRDRRGFRRLPKDQAKQLALEELAYWIQVNYFRKSENLLNPPFSQPQLRVFSPYAHNGMR